MHQNQAARTVIQQKRAAYASFEKAILDLYDRELLTLNQLDRIAERYRWTKIDDAGCQHVLTHDGKDVYQICIELIDPAFPIPVKGSFEDNEEYWEQELKKWEDIVRWRWGWHAYGVTTPGLQHQEKAA